MLSESQKQTERFSRKEELQSIVAKCRDYLIANQCTVSELFESTSMYNPRFTVKHRGVEVFVRGEIRKDNKLVLIVDRFRQNVRRFQQTAKRPLTDRFPEVVLAVENVADEILKAQADAKKRQMNAERTEASNIKIHEELGLNIYDRTVTCCGHVQGEPMFNMSLSGLDAHTVKVIMAIVRKGGAE